MTKKSSENVLLDLKEKMFILGVEDLTKNRKLFNNVIVFESTE